VTGRRLEFKGTHECWDYAVRVYGWASVPVLRDLLLAGIPDESIIGPANSEEGLEYIAVKISLDIFLGVLRKLDSKPKERTKCTYVTE
jgi:hypothetical protein